MFIEFFSFFKFRHFHENYDKIIKFFNIIVVHYDVPSWKKFFVLNFTATNVERKKKKERIFWSFLSLFLVH